MQQTDRKRRGLQFKVMLHQYYGMWCVAGRGSNLQHILAKKKEKKKKTLQSVQICLSINVLSCFKLKNSN
jgi:hypothetical protein